MTKKNKQTVAVAKENFWKRNEASNGILLKETVKKYGLSFFRAIILFGLCFMIIQPILNKIAVSFMAEQDLYDTTIVLVPKHFSVNNWKMASYLIEFNETLWNTIWV